MFQTYFNMGAIGYSVWFEFRYWNFILIKNSHFNDLYTFGCNSPDTPLS
jgi:hypothetical protein